MKNLFTLLGAIAFTIQVSNAQTTAMDFNMNDCNGQMHNLYSELDQNKAVILEFFMTNCNPCITAGNALTNLHEDLEMHYPGQVLFYHFPFNNSTTCATVADWVTSHGYNSVPFDSGAAQVAYYGGFGMPTVVVVAGTEHKILFTGIGFSTGDTSDIAEAVHEFFTASGVNVLPSAIASFSVFPNPASNLTTLQLQLREPTYLQLQLTDLSGKVISDIYNGNTPVGTMEHSISTASIADGLYIVKAIANGKETFSKLQVTH